MRSCQAKSSPFIHRLFKNRFGIMVLKGDLKMAHFHYPQVAQRQGFGIMGLKDGLGQKGG